MSALLAAALVAGLTGGLHCIGMCGPFAAASGPGWHLGKAASYMALGAIAGIGGRALPQGPWVALLAAVVLTMSALRFGGFLDHGEGGWLQRIAVSLARPARRLPAGLGPVALGALSAFLPCGLLWAALGIATAARTPDGGALVMAAFALGTTPLLVFADAVLRRLAQRARRVVALAVLAGGLLAIAHRESELHFVDSDGAVCAPPLVP